MLSAFNQLKSQLVGNLLTDNFHRVLYSILLSQVENGAPSTYIPSFALSEYNCTEYTQAKYNMRRMLGDLGHDIETSVFTIIDIYYNFSGSTLALWEKRYQFF